MNEDDKDIQELRDTIEELREENEELRGENKDLFERNETLEDVIGDIKYYLDRLR